MPVGPSVFVDFHHARGSPGGGQLVLLRFLCPETAKLAQADVDLQGLFQSGLDFWHHVAVEDEDEDALEETGRFNGKKDFSFYRRNGVILKLALTWQPLMMTNT